MISRRRDLHRHPELGFQEARTAGIVARELTRLGLEVRSGVGRTGVVGHLKGGKPGPTLLLRFDMDALPITEANTVDYVSQTPGVMHACGHDGHTAIGLAVAQMFSSLRDEISGGLLFVFQPAEELLEGSKAMIQDGVLEDFAPDRSLALHLVNDKPVGWIAATAGPTMAAGGKFRITVNGKGGHGALPHQTRDPVVAAAQIICTLQTVIARNVNPLDSAVISITSIRGGEAFNIIPPSVSMLGTLRALKTEVFQVVSRRIEEVARGVAQVMGCSAAIDLEMLTPAVVNDERMSGVVRALARELPEVTHVSDSERVMASEDMAHLMETIPGCYVFIGSGHAERSLNFPHHHPNFDFNERVLVLAATLMAKTAAYYTLQWTS